MPGPGLRGVWTRSYRGLDQVLNVKSLKVQRWKYPTEDVLVLVYPAQHARNLFRVGALDPKLNKSTLHSD